MREEIDIAFSAPLVDVRLIDPDADTEFEPMEATQPEVAPDHAGPLPDVENPEVDELSHQVLELQDEVDRLSGEVSALNSKVETQEGERQGLETQLANLAASLAMAEEESTLVAEQAAQTDQQTLQEVNAEKETIETVLRSMSDSVQGLKSQFKKMLIDMQTMTTELAVAIASRLLHEKIAADDYPVETLVRKVVKRLESAGSIVIRLHPDDLNLLKRRLGDEPLFLEDDAEIEIVSDDSLGRGDCRATAGDVSVASYLEDQLADIRQHVMVSD